MSKQTAKQPIPEFKTEAQERAYWETHDSTALKQKREGSFPDLATLHDFKAFG